MSNVIDIRKVGNAVVPTGVTPDALPTVGVPGSTIPKIKLFNASSYADAAGADSSNTSSISVPGVSDEAAAKVNALFGSLDDEGQAKIAQAGNDLATNLYKILAGGTGMNVQPESGSDSDSDSDDGDNEWAAKSPDLKLPKNNAAATQSLPQPATSLPVDSGSAAVAATAGSKRALTRATPIGVDGTNPNPVVSAPIAGTANGAAVTAVANATNTLQTTTGAGDYDTTVAGVTYMGILGLENQMGAFATDAKNQLNDTNKVRGQYADVTTALAHWPPGQEKQTFTWTKYDADGNKVGDVTQDLTQSEASALKDTLGDQVTAMSQQSQEAQLSLQNMTQNYQEAVNTLSNVLKFQFDTVKSIINNIRAG